LEIKGRSSFPSTWQIVLAKFYVVAIAGSKQVFGIFDGKCTKFSDEHKLILTAQRCLLQQEIQSF